MSMMFGFGLGFGSKRVVSSASYLDSVLDSACMDLDATQSASYGGTGQTWANLIASPADGSSQTDFDFHLGVDGSADTTDPTFTGTAGDIAAYFAMDGGDDFNVKASPDPAIFAKAHRTDQPGTWAAFAFKSPSGTNSYNLWGNGGGNGDIGVRAVVLNNDLSFRVSSGTGLQFINSLATINGDTDYIVILSWDGTSSTSNVRVWVNSLTGSTNDLAFSSSTSDNTSNHWEIANAGGSVTDLPMDSGGRVYHFSAGNEYLNDTKAQAIVEHIEARHGRDYTP